MDESGNGSATTSAHTIQKVRAMFGTHGLPELLVSDNGTAFTSGEIQELSHNGVQYLTSAAHHASSNGIAKRSVHSFKNNMQKFQTRMCRSSHQGLILLQIHFPYHHKFVVC